MLPLLVIERILWISTIAASALTLARFHHLGLHRIYRFFFAYLLLRTACSLALLPFKTEGSAYALLWLLTRPPIWISSFLVVRELYFLLFRNYPGIYTTARRTMYAAMIVFVGLSVLSLLPGSVASGEPQKVQFYFLLFRRGLDVGVVCSLLLMMSILAWYRVRPSKQLLRHSVIFSLYFLSDALGLFIRYVQGYEATRPVSTILLGASLASVLAWLILLDREPEHETLQPANWPASDEERLVSGMHALNTTLRRSARK